jgi:hypothetical protein
LHFSDVDLFFDESQYWSWSRELAFGYFSKPPLLAWLIAAAERVCGDSEACIRAPAPLLSNVLWNIDHGFLTPRHAGKAVIGRDKAIFALRNGRSRSCLQIASR